MARPLPSPLIPLPANSSSTAGVASNEDLFSTLFSPPTPRASPVPTPPNHRAGRPSISKPHARTHSTASTDSDFGAFVSVPATEDPLQDSGSASHMTPFSPIQNIEFFDRFTEDAKAATEKSKRGLLDELLRNEDDPLAFLQNVSSTSSTRTTTPVPSSSRTPPPDGDPRPAQEQTLVDLSPEFPLPEVRQSRHGARQQSRSEHSSAPLRSPSLPPSSPTRISNPEVQRAQSSFFTPTSLPSRWVSSFLSSAVRPVPHVRASTETLRHDEEHTVHQPGAHHTTTLPTALPSQVLGTISKAASGAADAAITHGSPFASQPFVPASGAPGFGGDREWNKGFEFDKANVEKISVRLVGRREITTPVLTVELADMLRPHFPALARLPRSWSLLYSLDQHGISLNTLYARCQSHTRGTLVIMRDSGDAVFGAWMGEGIHQSKGSYYGSGESFLWRLTSEKRLHIYKWTGKNDYVALCETEYLSFGGGEGRYGLYLDDTLIDGSSAWCPTFGNEPLCSTGPRQGENVRFECVGLEVWGVG